jgi:hypothetical protein
MHTTWELDRAGDPSDLGSSAKNRCHCRNGNGAYGTHETYETDRTRRLGEGRRQVRIRAWADRPRAVFLIGERCRRGGMKGTR